MKKAVLTAIIICVLACLLIACNAKNPTETDGLSNNAVETDVKFTVDKISELFANDYNAQEYDSDMIAHLLPNIENAGIILNGDIATVIHMTAKNSAPEGENWSWAYVYEFTDESDAIAFEENRRAFIEVTEENGACIRCGNIVVFGSAPVIASIAS